MSVEYHEEYVQVAKLAELNRFFEERSFSLAVGGDPLLVVLDVGEIVDRPFFLGLCFLHHL